MLKPAKPHDGGGVVYPAAFTECAEHSKRECDHNCDDNRAGNEFESRGKPLENPFQHWASVGETVAPLTHQKSLEPNEVLFRERAVEAQCDAESLDILRPDVWIGQVHLERAAWSGMYQRENENRNQEQEWNGLQRAPRYVSKHRLADLPFMNIPKDACIGRVAPEILQIRRNRVEPSDVVDRKLRNQLGD
jgi:hypothetical protein